ncbi:hypothetical protein [Pseudomonas violetae]|uniref:Uncharacterized protein n=1 Tax=Pseudomonas violetae TaxID=2915813 RepID=A0ABT0F220_9PSED|nr:hypothetical protein [Pseudomonas violetae]MCK1792066.1 hypothetical protein [Pseudomonas violetae]
MIRNVTVRHNNFLPIFSDAIVLYEAAVDCGNEVLQNALAKASILSVNYAIEAAANSFLESIEVTEKLKKKFDKFSTLDKFDFVLQWHTDNQLMLGDRHVQNVDNLISNRNAMVHPKVTPKIVQVNTSNNPGEQIKHSVIKPEPKKGRSQKPKLLGDDPELYTNRDAKEALIVMTSFLNVFVEQWWGIGHEAAEQFLFQTWDGSINARSVMFREHQIQTLIRNNEFLKIRFMGIYGMEETVGH